jgi:putative aldouronate transport system substrate-binding protein
VGKRIILIISSGLIFIALIGSIVYCINLSKQPEEEDFNLFGDKVKPLEKTNITFYFQAFSPEYQIEEPENVREVLDEIERRTLDQLNIYIDIKWVWYRYDDFINHIKSIVSSGQPCDAFGYTVQPYGSGKYDLLSLNQEEMLLDIGSLLPRYAPSLYSKYSSKELDAATIDKKLVAIPNRFIKTDKKCLVVRDDLIDKYGIKGFDGYSDVEAFLRAVKANDSDFTPLSIKDTTIGLFAEEYGYAILDYKLGMVYKWSDPTMRIMSWENTSEYKTALDRLNNWYKSGLIGTQWSFDLPKDEDIYSGKFAAFIAEEGTEHDFNKVLASNGIKDFKYREFPINQSFSSARSNPIENAIVINSQSKNAKMVLKFIEWLNSSQDNYDLFLYGIKGRHFDLKDNKYLVLKSSKNEIPYINWPGREFFKNIEFDRPGENDFNDYKIRYKNTIEAKTQYPPHIGFKIDNTKISGILNQYMITRGFAYKNMEKKIQNGDYSEKSIEEYINSQKESGMDGSVMEIQKLIDGWNKEKIEVELE